MERSAGFVLRQTGAAARLVQVPALAPVLLLRLRLEDALVRLRAAGPAASGPVGIGLVGAAAGSRPGGP
ncbi:hypothetical protein [Streptomyces sp. Wb2n-11]|uniref:hypothetical protein n=1 Tax=Streptomyces sp. Wb2n-11 TaxID=1030533 RepID=UPI000B8277B7|nr:hypothetical protein [Streptomyces sp. Wb2n-11]